MPDAGPVTLRARTEEDLDVLFRIAAELETFEERKPGFPAPMTRAEFDARQAHELEQGLPPGSARFVVEVGGEAVGGASLFDVDPLARHAELGISLLPEARGRGTGTAATALLVEFAFVRCNLRRLHLEAIASNAGALRAYEKVGFVVEGRQREHAWVRGRYEDIVRMGLLRADWSAARA